MEHGHYNEHSSYDDESYDEESSSDDRRHSKKKRKKHYASNDDDDYIRGIMNDRKEEWRIADDLRFCKRVEKDKIEDDCMKMQEEMIAMQTNMSEVNAKLDAQA